MNCCSKLDVGFFINMITQQGVGVFSKGSEPHTCSKSEAYYPLKIDLQQETFSLDVKGNL